MKHIPGADPELVLLNHYYEELDVSLACYAFSFFMYAVLMPFKDSTDEISVFSNNLVFRFY